MDENVGLIVMGLFMTMGGLFSFLGARRRWKFFLQNRKVRFIARILGEKGMIIFYQILGIFLALCGFGGFCLGLLAKLGIIDISE